jgi:hypothetical protein
MHNRTSDVKREVPLQVCAKSINDL